MHMSHHIKVVYPSGICGAVDSELAMSSSGYGAVHSDLLYTLDLLLRLCPCKLLLVAMPGSVSWCSAYNGPRSRNLCLVHCARTVNNELVFAVHVAWLRAVCVRCMLRYILISCPCTLL